MQNPGECNVRIKTGIMTPLSKEAMNAANTVPKLKQENKRILQLCRLAGAGGIPGSFRQEAEETMTISKDSGGIIKTKDNIDFFALLTGDFYSYANLTMTTCTLTNEEQESTYYIAARGDRVSGLHYG